MLCSAKLLRWRRTLPTFPRGQDSGAPVSGSWDLSPAEGIYLSWRATAFVKALSQNADGSPLSAREKLVLFVLADYHNEERNCCWASLSSIAGASLTSRRHLVTLLDGLERKGTLQIERRDKNTNLYRFAQIPREVASLGGEVASLGVVKSRVHQGGEVATAPEPPYNRQDSKTIGKTVLMNQFPTWLPVEAWNAYLEMRRKNKKPLVTDRGIAKAINTLEKLKDQGYEPDEVLDQSTFHSWQGLFPIRGQAAAQVLKDEWGEYEITPEGFRRYKT